MVEPDHANRFYAKEIPEIFRELDSDPDAGLTSKEANARLVDHGRNELPTVKKSFYRLYIAPFLENTIVIIYLISAGIMVTLNLIIGSTEWSPYLNFIIVLFNAVTAIIQQVRAQKSLDALRQFSKEECTVIRDGVKTRIEAKYVVPGDILDLQEGDKIPADARIITANSLFINESSITGESISVQKFPGTLANQYIDLHDRKNTVFKGTFVTKGNGNGIVFHTGDKTEIGKITHNLEALSQPEIPLTKKINHFANILGIIVIIMFAISVIFKLAANTGGANAIIQDIVLSIDLALKFIPINIILLATIILITGVLAMANKGVIVRNLTSIEALGRASVVCTDKTGTLTQNAMTVQHVWTGNRVFDVSGTGYTSNGNIYLDGKIIEKNEYKSLKNLVISGLMNNNAVLVEEGFKVLDGIKQKKKKVRKVIGDPMEAALDVLAEKLHVSEEKLKKEYEFIKEYPFDSEVKRMTKIWAPNDQEWIAFVKGATELILDRSSSYTGVNDERQALDTDMKKTIRDEIDSWATKGFRTLGIASKELEKRENENAYSRDEVEKDLNFIGFVIIQDPPRDGVIDAVKECEAAGVKVVMITGDSPTTGAAIGSELGIYQEGETVYEGKDVRELPEKEFESTAVFARVSPADKQQIVQRYQDKDKVVAMTGDGVNDALALGMADIGLAMGISGTDVAKEAADMIISDDSFNTIERGIREGRGLFAKIRVMMYFFVYANLTEAIILFTTSFVHPDFRLFDTAWQIQLIYILPHSIPPLGLTFDRTSSDIMREKPRDEEEIFNRNVMILMIANISTLAIGLAIASIPIVNAFFMNPSLIGSTDPADIAQLNANMARPRTIALAVVFIIEVLTLFSVRRPNIPVYKSFRKDMSPLFLIFAVGTLLSLFFIIYVESVAESFLLVPLTGEDWLVVMALGLPALPILEIIKVVLRKKGEHF